MSVLDEKDLAFLNLALKFLHGQITGDRTDKSLLKLTVSELNHDMYTDLIKNILDLKFGRSKEKNRDLDPEITSELEGKTICHHYHLDQYPPIRIRILVLMDGSRMAYTVKVIMYKFKEMDLESQTAVVMGAHRRTGQASPLNLLPVGLLTDNIMSHFSHVKYRFYESNNPQILRVLLDLICEKRMVDEEVQDFYCGADGDIEKNIIFS